MKQNTFTIQYDDVKLNVSAAVQHRDADWILCLHGLQSNKELFEDLLKQPFASSYSVAALDLVGFGHSAKPLHFSYDLEDQANIVKEFVRELGIKKLIIIGHSMGAMIATLLLQPLGKMIDSFVNMEGNLVLADCGPSKEVVETSFSEFQANGYRAIKSRVENDPEIGSRDRARWINDVPDFAFYKTCESIVGWSKSGRVLDKFVDAPCRKLFMYGAENRRKIHSLPSTIEQAEIPNSGHFMLQTNPIDCYETIKNFVVYESNMKA